MPRKKKVSTKAVKKSARSSSQVASKRGRPAKAKTKVNSTSASKKGRATKAKAARVTKGKKATAISTPVNMTAKIIEFEQKLIQTYEKAAEQGKKAADKAGTAFIAAEKKYKTNVEKLKKAQIKPATTVAALSRIAKLQEVITISAAAVKAAKNELILAKNAADVASLAAKYAKKAVTAQSKAKKAVQKDEKAAAKKIADKTKKEKEKAKKEAEKRLKEVKKLSAKQKSTKKKATSKRSAGKKTATKKTTKSTAKSKSALKTAKKKSTAATKKRSRKPTKKAVTQTEAVIEETPIILEDTLNTDAVFSSDLNEANVSEHPELETSSKEPALDSAIDVAAEINRIGNDQATHSGTAVVGDLDEDEENTRSLFSPLDDL